MIKCEVLEKFKLKDFDKLKNITRKSIEVKGFLFAGDTFECDEEMVKYLSGANAYKKAYVKVIEIIPEAKPEPTPIVEKPKPKKKKTNKK